MNFCVAALMLKMEENTQYFRPIMHYSFKKGKNATEMQKTKCVQCVEKVIERVRSGLRSFLVLLTFWPNNSLLWGCLMHWKMFSSTPGLHPLEAIRGR